MGWEVLTGVIEWWADEGLRDIGRRRFHRARAKVSDEPGLPCGSIDVTRHAFVVRRTPWRLAQVSLESTDPREPGTAWRTSDDDLSPAVVVGRRGHSGAQGQPRDATSRATERVLG
jgi:hypothetical protein